MEKNAALFAICDERLAVERGDHLNTFGRIWKRCDAVMNLRFSNLSIGPVQSPRRTGK